jgi:hypothetical protein
MRSGRHSPPGFCLYNSAVHVHPALAPVPHEMLVTPKHKPFAHESHLTPLRRGGRLYTGNQLLLNNSLSGRRSLVASYSRGNLAVWSRRRGHAGQLVTFRGVESFQSLIHNMYHNSISTVAASSYLKAIRLQLSSRKIVFATCRQISKFTPLTPQLLINYGVEEMRK